MTTVSAGAHLMMVILERKSPQELVSERPGQNGQLLRTRKDKKGRGKEEAAFYLPRRPDLARGPVHRGQVTLSTQSIGEQCLCEKNQSSQFSFKISWIFAEVLWLRGVLNSLYGGAVEAKARMADAESGRRTRRAPTEETQGCETKIFGKNHGKLLIGSLSRHWAGESSQ